MTRSSLMTDLMAVIQDRKTRTETEKSYVAGLLRGGVPKIGAKITEEAAEVVEAGDEPGEEGRVHLVKEVADLVFHSLVMLAHRDLGWDDVEDELARRFGISGIDEKAARNKPAQ
ncbi:phosphoribosyl-ATP diphosphatase [Aquisphaera insulae]|uniref:phosphoribosyl-ATP diphosphatase n=1 Tax=Aquisphaera insulae TaxID=2712864 RepID=UPI0013EB841F|nr:phosphoribosyl-ATP diphosphatase [Aquisphaera insulae]